VATSTGAPGVPVAVAAGSGVEVGDDGADGTAEVGATGGVAVAAGEDAAGEDGAGAPPPEPAQPATSAPAAATTSSRREDRILPESAAPSARCHDDPVRPLPSTWTVTLPDPDWVDDLPSLPDGVRAAVWDVAHPPGDVLGDAADDVAVVVLPYMSSPAAIGTLRELPGLRLVQTLTTGYDGVPEHVPDGVGLATASGVHDASTGELAVGLLLATLRGIDDAVRDAEAGRWRHLTRRSLADRRVLLLGTGGIGRAVAERLLPFEVVLTRVASTARTDDLGPVHGVDELSALLPDHDVVVLAVPLSPATHHLVDAEFLAAMPDGAVLVNVARGPVVDTGALLGELRRHRLRAALDVVDPEPLPEDHPLWGAPGLLLTPHVGGDTTAMRPRALALLRDQLERLASGREPRNLVER
jgi:phosphoglycerate dehydrogenase-like enzyme